MSSVDVRGQIGEGYTDEDYQKMQEGMRDGSGIELPFAHLVAWAFNGDSRLSAVAKTSPTSYYGGWNFDYDKAKEMNESGMLKLGLDHTGWIMTERDSREQKKYKTYETRSLHVAPICKRFSWISKDGKSRIPEYNTLHPRSHLQILALVGVTTHIGPTAEIAYVAPCILSVKGKGQTVALGEALMKWCRNIDALRTEMNAKGIPYFAWWQTIGTRGDTPEFQMMGSGKDKSAITPLRAIMATEKLTAEHMGKRFVGKELFALAADLAKQAEEWRNAWKTPITERGRGDQNAPGQQHGDAHEGNDDVNRRFQDAGAGSMETDKDIPFG